MDKIARVLVLPLNISYLSHALGFKAMSAARLHISIFLERISMSAGSILFSGLSASAGVFADDAGHFVFRQWM